MCHVIRNDILFGVLIKRNVDSSLKFIPEGMFKELFAIVRIDQGLVAPARIWFLRPLKSHHPGTNYLAMSYGLSLVSVIAIQGVLCSAGKPCGLRGDFLSFYPIQSSTATSEALLATASALAGRYTVIAKTKQLYQSESIDPCKPCKFPKRAARKQQLPCPDLV